MQNLIVNFFKKRGLVFFYCTYNIYQKEEKNMEYMRRK